MKKSGTKCRRCGETGVVVELRRHNAAVCRMVEPFERKRERDEARAERREKSA